MTEIDDIRGALATLAAQAPPPERVRSALLAGIDRRRQRRLVLRVAGAGAATAGLGVAGVGGYRLVTRPEFPQVMGGPGGGWLEAPLHVRPGWLPPRHGHTRRGVLVDGDTAASVSMEWEPPGASADAQVALTVGWHEVMAASMPTGPTRAAEVRGVRAEVISTPGPPSWATYVVWQPPGVPRLILAVLDGSGREEQEDLALRVARSVRATTGTIAVGPRLGWLPPDAAGAPWLLQVGQRNGAWVEDFVTMNSGNRVSGQFGPGVTDRFDSTMPTVPVPSLPDDAVAAPDGSTLYVSRPDGVEAMFVLETSGGTAPVEVLTRVVAEFDFGPWPDMSWFGRR